MVTHPHIRHLEAATQQTFDTYQALLKLASDMQAKRNAETQLAIQNLPLNTPKNGG